MMTSEAATNEQALEITDEQAARLHHRSVLGEKLSEYEKKVLQAWYELQDRLEAEQLGLATRKRSVAELEQRINMVVQQISETIRLNNEIVTHNSAMLSELVALKNALPLASSTRVAR